MNLFETRNTDLAAFLLTNGIDLLKFASREEVIYMIFADPLQKCADLERVYLNSECKKFRDNHLWLVARIHEQLKGEK